MKKLLIISTLVILGIACTKEEEMNPKQQDYSQLVGNVYNCIETNDGDIRFYTDSTAYISNRRADYRISNDSIYYKEINDPERCFGYDLLITDTCFFISRTNYLKEEIIYCYDKL